MAVNIPKLMKNNCFFSSNLKLLRDRKGLNQQQLANEIGSNRSQINAYENNQIKNPTVEILIAISEYFKLSIDILMKADLTKVSEIKIGEYQSRKDAEISGKQLRVVVATVNTNEKPVIAHVPIKAKAGYLVGYGDKEFIGSLPSYTLPFLSREKSYRSFQIEGDSMYPFPEKAIVIGEHVDDWFSLKDHTPCIVVTREEGIAFKLVTNKIKNERIIQLSSLNPIYQPYNVNVMDVYEIWKYNYYISDTIVDNEDSISRINTAINDIRSDLKTLLQKQ